MAPTLTLHQGAAHVEFVEHPTETAPKAPLAAAELEARWGLVLARSGRRRAGGSLARFLS